jgi:hypothetical protein
MSPNDSKDRERGVFGGDALREDAERYDLVAEILRAEADPAKAPAEEMPAALRRLDERRAMLRLAERFEQKAAKIRALADRTAGPAAQVALGRDGRPSTDPESPRP